MIVRNEERNLGRCLESVNGVFDQVVVVDTGSTDRTKEIAKSFGAEVHDFVWIDDFSAARNFSYSKIRTDFVSWIDADDIYKPEDREKLLALKARLGRDGDAYLFRYDYAQDEYGNSICSLYRHRVVRMHRDLRWNHPIHECMGIPYGYRHHTEDITITHLRTPQDAAQDTGRNLRMLRKAVERDPEDARMRFYFGKELVHEGKFAEAIPILMEFVKRPDWHENGVQALHQLAIAYFNTRDEKKTIETCLKGIHKDPRWAEFFVLIGEVYYQRAMSKPAQEIWQLAAQWFELASHLKPPESWGTVQPDNYTWVPHDRLAKCYAELYKPRLAYEHNEKALSFKPNEPRFLYNRQYFRDTLFDLRSPRPYRLNLGAGGQPVPSYRQADIYEGPGIEFVFDQGALPYRDHTVHAIYSEHALEHAADHRTARAVVTEWARALRFGGHLRLKLPDLDLCCQAFAQAEDRARRSGERWTPKEWYRLTIYGLQEPLGDSPAEGQHHRTGFTKPELRRLLEANGFEVKRVENYDGYGTPSIDAEAVQRAAPLKVRWLLRNAHEEDPSTRIRRLNISWRLTQYGVDSMVDETYRKGADNALEMLDVLRDADVVVFTQFGDMEKELADLLNHSGIVTVYDMNEDLGDQLPAQREFLEFVRKPVFCSTEMAKKYGKGLRGTVIPDAYEIPKNVVQRSYAPHGAGGRVRVVWCGMGGNAKNCDFLRPIMDELGMEFMTISEWSDATRPWKADRWLEDLADADIVIAPQRVQLQPCKSNTKATQAMSLGLPVVASPLTAYDEAIIEGETGFICRTPEDWKTALTALRDDQSLRERIGQAAKKAVEKEYSPDAITRAWISVLEALCLENCNPPAVDIIIPTYNNLEYLKACVESIRKNTDWPYNLIIVDSGTDGTADWIRQEPQIFAWHHSDTRLHFSEANNVGLRLGKAPFVCLLNDDTIVSQGWLTGLMHEAMKPGVGAVGPFSNCDQTWLHNDRITVGDRDLHPGMSMDQVRDILPAIQTFRRPKTIHPREWLAFYCTLLPRQVVSEIGLLDEDFKSGCEDRDYCYRIEKAGYRFLQTYDSWVFHFGGRTRTITKTENAERHIAEDAYNYDVLNRKHPGSMKQPVSAPRPQTAPVSAPVPTASRKPVFVLYTGGAWERWSPRNVDGEGIGGSETCAVHVAREFARQGWRSIVFGDCAGFEGEYDGVQYVDHAKFVDFVRNETMDFFVSSRRPEAFSVPIRAARTACWVHDIWLDRNPNADLHVDQVGKFLVLSPWHRDFFLKHHRGVPPEKLHITRDVIDLSRYADRVRKAPGRLVYSSSPDRGLDCLMDLLPSIQQEVPDTELHVFYGFHNWETSARQRGDQALLQRIEALKQRLASQRGVVFRGRVGQRDLAREQMKAEVFAYPTWFTETFCITAAEHMAAGAAVVTTDVAALPTTVGDAGVIVPVPHDTFDCGLTDDPTFRTRFVEECIRALTDAKHREDLAERGRQKAKGYGIEGIVDEWLAAVEPSGSTSTPQRNGNGSPDVVNLLTLGDVDGARAAAAKQNLPRVTEMIERSMAHLEDESRYVQIYSANELEGQVRVPGRFHMSPFDERQREMERLVLRAARPEVLDVGCADGSFLLGIASRIRRGLGVDLWKEGLEAARNACTQRRIQNLTFVDGLFEKAHVPHKFDVIVCGEILKYCADPVALLRKCVDLLKLDGALIVTVPVGRPEPDQAELEYIMSERPRAHVRYIDERILKAYADQAGLAPETSVRIGVGWVCLVSSLRKALVHA